MIGVGHVKKSIKYTVAFLNNEIQSVRDTIASEDNMSSIAESQRKLRELELELQVFNEFDNRYNN